MKITLPRKVLMIINNLQLHGYEAFAVGGCVRDPPGRRKSRNCSEELWIRGSSMELSLF